MALSLQLGFIYLVSERPPGGGARAAAFSGFALTLRRQS
jgi:hypothetical protein